MYKLIAIDIDGTLLNSYGEVSEKNKKAIKKALDKNVYVILTSGRMPKAVLPIANEVCANKYLISGNGASIYDIEKSEIIYNNYMTKEKVLEIIDTCEKNSVFYNVYTNDVILTKSLNYNILFYHNENKKNAEDKKIKINIIEDMYDYIKKYDRDDLLKITICDSDRMIFKGVVNKIKTIRDVDVLEIGHMSRKIIKHGTDDLEISYFYTEVSNKNVNKWTAIEELIKKLDVKKEEVIAIGDNMNDREMIQNAGIGIATGNSCPYIKEIANEIVSTNDESGVAEAIEKYIK